VRSLEERLRPVFPAAGLGDPVDSAAVEAVEAADAAADPP
jgi:hypothetical protein